MQSFLQVIAMSGAFAVAYARLPHKLRAQSTSNAVNFFRYEHRKEVALTRGPHPYGDPTCPCVAFDNLQGDLWIKIDGKTVAYPAETGSTCHAWDYLHYPRQCNTGTDDDFARNATYPDWCLQQWCYVDPCNCALPAPPKVSKYMPDSIYQGKALYYSYATCGETDQWTAQHNAGKAAYFEVVKGQCTLNEDATCVFSPNYPEKYENNQKCEIMGPPGAVIQTNSFETEHGFDFMTIDGLEYHGGKGPNEVMLKSGKIEWYSDGWVTAKGWKLCTETQEGACVMQPDEVHCKRLDKCSWLDGKCLGKEAAGACKIDDPIWGSQDPPCQCIGIDGLEGDVLANTGPVGGREKLAKYPMDVGAKCKSWDAAHHPDCTGPAAPEWCLQKWCYVSPCNCKLTTPPKLSGYFPTVYH